MIKEWVKEELEAVKLGDIRLDDRLKHLLTAASDQPGKSLNRMFNTRAETQACYRFFSNSLVKESKIISPHINKTFERAAAHPIVLHLSDTTSLNYTTRKSQKDSGYISSNNAQGFFLHTSLAVTPDRLHLGIADNKIWSREKEKPTTVVHRDYKAIEDKESYRWLEAYRNACELAKSCQNSQIIHVTDREGDIFEVLHEYQCQKESGVVADFVIRSNHNRSVYSEKDGTCNIWLKETKNLVDVKLNNACRFIFKQPDMPAVRSISYSACEIRKKKLSQSVKNTKKIVRRSFKTPTIKPKLLYDALEKSKKLGEISFEITKRDSNETRLVHQTVRALQITIKRFEDGIESVIKINAIYLEETNPPEGENPVIWRLITSLPIGTIQEILKTIKYYLCRWEIEIFFKTYKSGCKVEEKSLRAAERLFPLFCLLLIVAWRVNYLLHMSRTAPQISCEVFFEPSEWKAAYVAATRNRQFPASPPNMGEMMSYIAILGGHLGRKSDPKPGPKVTWIGMCKLAHYADAWDLFGPGMKNAEN